MSPSILAMEMFQLYQVVRRTSLNLEKCRSSTTRIASKSNISGFPCFTSKLYFQHPSKVYNLPQNLHAVKTSSLPERTPVPSFGAWTLHVPYYLLLIREKLLDRQMHRHFNSSIPNWHLQKPYGSVLNFYQALSKRFRIVWEHKLNYVRYQRSLFWVFAAFLVNTCTNL